MCVSHDYIHDVYRDFDSYTLTPCGSSYWYYSSLILVIMVASTLAKVFLVLFHLLLVFLVWCIFFPRLSHITLLWIVDSQHDVMV